ncbi:tetratricopeptide repeat protein, partial [Aliarcobacter butzleri]|uniref:tetratricopeptide repeat protein n=1 Tax=Aliarcobacter butzleri TaxID=28197 RepID=UPI001EDC715C
MLQTNYRYKYNPSEINKKDFLASFSVRKEIFQEIFDDIKRTDYSVPSQHFVIIGQRGQGKTTLLRKLYFEIEQDKELSSFLIPLQLTEEQYQIRTLCRLWEVVAEYLELNNSELFKNLIDFMENQSELDDYELNCFNYLEKSIKAQNKKVILLVDNIDELFGKLKDKEQKQLREILLSSSTFKIIGASTKMFEQHYDYAKPFYEFFKIIQLRGLNKSETKEFLKSIANNEQKEKIENIIITQYNKIETLRQLTGGVPRTFVMLFDIFMDEEGNAFDDLIRILDEVTPLYKHRMDDLSPILQDIVHTIALNWDGILTKDIAKKTRLTSSEVSSHLKQLEKYQIIESTSLGKNKIYKIEERFFNIWYLMRFGRKKDRNRVEWLVKFLSTWYTKEELEKKSLQLIEASKEKKIKENYLYYMCEALSYTGLLDLKIEHTLKKNTKEFLEKINSNYATDVSKSVYDLLEKAIKLLEDQKLEDAIMLLEKSKNENQKIFEFLGALYSEQKEYKKAEEYYLKAIENGNNDALNSLGALYSEQKEYKKTEEYYLKAIKNGNNDALNNLGALYKNQKEYKKAEEYFLKAIKNGNNDALNNLGVLYSEQKEYKKAEHYYLKAIETGNNNALNSLGALYSEQKEYKKAEQYFLKAIENGNNIALNNLAILYSVQKEYKKAEEYYLKAIENGSNDALNSLGALYSDQKEYKKAEEYYLKAIENGNNDALNNLGVLYSDQKEYKKAEEYYLKAIENGVND